jgi:hypothetical protein
MLAEINTDGASRPKPPPPKEAIRELIKLNTALWKLRKLAIFLGFSDLSLDFSKAILMYSRFPPEDFGENLRHRYAASQINNGVVMKAATGLSISLSLAIIPN